MLARLPVLVLDCQATGASPAFGHVLELGWGVTNPETEGAAAEAHWIALPEGHRVPAQVRKLTGYDPHDVAGALKDADAWKKLRAAARADAPVPTVIHFARFELTFMRAWATRFEPETPFPLDVVCLHEIANRLLPELPRSSLRALAGYHGYSLHLARRSLGHVEATAFVWRQIVPQLAARGIATWPDLKSWLAAKTSPRSRPRKPVYPVDRERYRSLPDAPGVYRFLRRNGDVLYVGKAASLRKRTSSHFLGRTGKLVAPEMLTQVHDIAVTVTASALEAALLENETIKALRPPYNVHLVDDGSPIWYATRDFRTAGSAAGVDHVVGPLPSAFSLRPLAALTALLAGRAPALEVRADVVGVSALWTPDEPMFTEGWHLFRERHGLAALDGDPRQGALSLARQLLSVSATATDAGEEDPASDTGDEALRWDPERVARHIERAATQAYRLFRRARWLTLLHDCDITYREPDAAEVRTLRLRAGALVPESDVSFGAGTVAPRALLAPLPFDRARYDRLRILTTELKRIVRDGGDVAIWPAGRSRPLMASWLRGIFRLV